MRFNTELSRILLEARAINIGLLTNHVLLYTLNFECDACQHFGILTYCLSANVYRYSSYYVDTSPPLRSDLLAIDVALPPNKLQVFAPTPDMDGSSMML